MDSSLRSTAVSNALASSCSFLANVYMSRAASWLLAGRPTAGATGTAPRRNCSLLPCCCGSTAPRGCCTSACGGFALCGLLSATTSISSSSSLSSSSSDSCRIFFVFRLFFRLFGQVVFVFVVRPLNACAFFCRPPARGNAAARAIATFNCVHSFPIVIVRRHVVLHKTRRIRCRSSGRCLQRGRSRAVGKHRFGARRQWLFVVSRGIVCRFSAIK